MNTEQVLALTSRVGAPYSYYDVTGNGEETSFVFSFVGVAPGYIRVSDVVPFLRNSDVADEEGYNYYSEISEGFTISGNTIVFDVAPPVPLDGLPNIRIRRIMPKDRTYADTESDAIFRKRNLNYSFLQQLYAQHEVLDGFTGATAAQNDLDMDNKRIKNLGDAINHQDAVNLRQFEEIVQGTRDAIDLAFGWAQTAEDVQVDDGIHPVGFSAFHWSQKAEDQAILAASEADDSASSASFSQQQADRAESEADRAEGILIGKVDRIGNPDTGGAVIPMGSSAETPDPAGKAVVRFEQGKGYVGYNPQTGLWGALGGIGNYIHVTALSHEAKPGQPLAIDISDGQNRSVTIPRGWADGSSLFIVLVGWDKSSPVTVAVTLESGESWSGEPGKQTMILTGAMAVSLQRVNGEFVITQASR